MRNNDRKKDIIQWIGATLRNEELNDMSLSAQNWYNKYQKSNLWSVYHLKKMAFFKIFNVLYQVIPGYNGYKKKNIQHKP